MGRHQTFVDVFPPLTFVGNHDVTRIASQLREPGHLGHALSVLFTLPGNPAIYAGDEQGWRSIKYHREGADAEIRRPFPGVPAELGEDGGPHYRLHRELIRVRRARPFLATGRIRVCHLASQQLVLGAEPRNPDPIAADTPVRHRLRGLEAWLDYLVPLGWTVLGAGA